MAPLCQVCGGLAIAAGTARYRIGGRFRKEIVSATELKSLKLYMWGYRSEGAFHEDVTNRILDDLVRLLAPRRMEVVGDWNVRGGIKTVVTARHEAGRRPRRRRA